MDIIVEKPGLQTKQQFYDVTLELEQYLGSSPCRPNASGP